jgi:hypothetical protein
MLEERLGVPEWKDKGSWTDFAEDIVRTYYGKKSRNLILIKDLTTNKVFTKTEPNESQR